MKTALTLPEIAKRICADLAKSPAYRREVRAAIDRDRLLKMPCSRRIQ